MLNSFIIVMREGFESFLLVAVILAYLRKSGQKLLASVRLPAWLPVCAGPGGEVPTCCSPDHALHACYDLCHRSYPEHFSYSRRSQRHRTSCVRANKSCSRAAWSARTRMGRRRLSHGAGSLGEHGSPELFLSRHAGWSALARSRACRRHSHLHRTR